MTARPEPFVHEVEPAERFLTRLDRDVGLVATPLATWPATILYWKAKFIGLTRALRNQHQCVGTAVPSVKRQGEAG